MTCGAKVNASSSALATTSVNSRRARARTCSATRRTSCRPSATSSSCSSFLYFDFLTIAFATSGVRTGWPRSPCSSSSPAGCQSARVPFCAIVSLNVPPRDGASAYVGLKVHVSGFFGQPPAVFWATLHEPVTSWRPIAQLRAAEGALALSADEQPLYELPPAVHGNCSSAQNRCAQRSSAVKALERAQRNYGVGVRRRRLPAGPGAAAQHRARAAAGACRDRG